MLNKKRVVVVLPAYNAARTLRRTVDEIPREIVDEIILTDDASRDNTSELAREMGLITARGADIVVMLHPDYQYTPKLVSAMASMIAYGEYDGVLASRILGRGALKGGMPLYKYIANRGLTFIENLLIWEKMSEYHTGYRAWSRELLERLPLLSCSDDFVFDNQMVVQAVYFGFRIGEISCPTKYFEEASSINFQRSVTYGFGVLGTAMSLRLKRWGLTKPAFLADVPYERLLSDTSATHSQSISLG
jgi:glycosyltransferase involved in cell wall biosynthesis